MRNRAPMKKALLLAMLVSACSVKSTSPAPAPSSTPTEETAPAPEESTPEEPAASKPELFGDPLKGASQVSIQDITASPDSYNKKTVRTEGVVRAVCQERGCWME